MTATLATPEFHIPLPADMAEDAQDAQASTTHTIEAIEWSTTSHLANGVDAPAVEWDIALQGVSERIRSTTRWAAADHVDEDGGTYDDLDHGAASHVLATAISVAYDILTCR
ncbi:hypothetical protein [Streptosporangium canum]|uniref:hypothetical protein n=1 Tax=Streptosporangium canum TaxID=324952 RepID=UPI00379A631E